MQKINIIFYKGDTCYVSSFYAQITFYTTKFTKKQKNNIKSNLWIMWITLWITINTGFEDVSFTHIHKYKE